MRLTVLISLSFLITSLCGQSQQAAIQSCFKGYKAAIIEGRGSDAADLVDFNTLKYYSDMLEMAIYADSASVQESGMIDKMTILTTRHKIPKDTLMTMNGRSFFIYAINSGMIGKNSVVAMDLGAIEINDDFAKGQVVSAGQPSPLYFEFIVEDGDWKMDITSIFPASTLALNQMLASNGQTENDFILQMLELLTMKKVNNSIWQPL